MSDPVAAARTHSAGPTRTRPTPGTHSYGCVVGGGTVTYGGSSWRHLPWEFNEATVTGGVPGTGLADWPITYEELEPYYVQAEWEMGISGHARQLAVPRADVEGLSGPAGAAEGVGRADEDRRRETRADRGARAARDHLARPTRAARPA